MWLHFNRRHAFYLGFTICHGNCRRSSSSTVTVFDSQEQIRQRSEDTHVTADRSQIEGVHVRKAQKQAVLSLLSFTFACRLLLRPSWADTSRLTYQSHLLAFYPCAQSLRPFLDEILLLL